jgi:Ca-activated chloride channel homolog
MKSRVNRYLAAVLIATFIATLWPLGSGGAIAGQSQDSASSRPRRGKNGGPASRSAPVQPVQPVRDEDKDSTQETRPAPPQTSSQGRQQEPERNQQHNQPQSSARPAHQEPPPFDRPVNSGARPQSDQSSTADPSFDRTAPDTRATRRVDPPARSRPAEQQYPPAGRDANNYPNAPARRDADGDQPDDRSRGQRPVLRRPSDSVPQSERNSPRPSGADSDRTADTTGQADDSPDDEVIRLESTLVNIPLLVSDRSGRYISQLSKRDFQLYEDGVEQELASFSSEEVPFSVVLLLDMSPSVQGSTDAIQDAALAFVKQMRPQDRMMVASFDRSVQYLTDFTTDRRQLEYAIRRVQTGSGTSVYDAVYETVTRRLRNIEGRKALILFSDGEDTTSSQTDYDGAVEAVSESDVLVYGLRYPGGGGGSIRVDPWPGNRIPQIPFPLPWPWPRRRRGPFKLTSLTPSASSVAALSSPQWNRRRGGGDFMTDITAAGGGPVYDAQQISDLSRIAHQIAEELRHIYVVSYYPTNKLSNGGYRSIRIRVRARDDIAIRHRKGYNASEANRPTRTE